MASSSAAPSPLPVDDHCLAPGRDADGAGGYGRMFGDLPPLRTGEAYFAEQGRRAISGESSPYRQDTDADDDPALPAAGWPVFAQFLAHDLTADRSGLVSRTALGTLRNARTPRLDLECVYGSGPVDRPYLMQRAAPARLLVGGTPEAPDLPRNQEGVALLGDPRNDVHALISQLHVRMLAVHNAIEEQLEGVAAGDRFAAAQQELRWHYQWAVLHEYLDVAVGPELAEEVRTEGPRWFRAEGAVRLPVEFADAAFRSGHGQVRERYRLQPGGPEINLFPDLVGFRPIEDRRVDLSLLFDLPARAPSPQRCKRLDGRLAASLIRLPVEVTGELDEATSHHRSLAVRDLQRGVATGLPSGEAVARRMGADPLAADEIGAAENGWEGETPLWFYILKEAEVRAGGRHLGPVGGRIVAEVLLSVVDGDPTSFRTMQPDWTPSLPAEGTFGVGDLLAVGA
jgi:hypothetical protein